jgi:hypothetical protein
VKELETTAKYRVNLGKVFIESYVEDGYNVSGRRLQLVFTFDHIHLYVKSEDILKSTAHCAKGNLLEVAQLSEKREADKVTRSYVKYKFIFLKISNGKASIILSASNPA